MNNTNPFITVWFWLLILSIILLVVTLILFEVYIRNQPGGIPWWIWLILALGLVTFITALIIYQATITTMKSTQLSCTYIPTPPPIMDQSVHVIHITPEPIASESIYSDQITCKPLKELKQLNPITVDLVDKDINQHREITSVCAPCPVQSVQSVQCARVY
jgi:hypothetical protein